MDENNVPTYEQLLQENATLRERIVALEEMVTRLMKNSSNSSKPPSSDIVKPGGGKGGKCTGRKIGGQPGHKRYERVEFGPDEIDEVRTYGMSECPVCGGTVEVATGVKPRVVQQVEIVPRPIIVTEHRGAAYRTKCGQIHYGAAA